MLVSPTERVQTCIHAHAQLQTPTCNEKNARTHSCWNARAWCPASCRTRRPVQNSANGHVIQVRRYIRVCCSWGVSRIQIVGCHCSHIGCRSTRIHTRARARAHTHTHTGTHTHTNMYICIYVTYRRAAGVQSAAGCCVT